MAGRKLGDDLIERTQSLGHALRGHVQVGLRGVQVGVSEQKLNHPWAGAVLDQMRGVGMAKGVRGHFLAEPSAPADALEVFLHRRWFDRNRGIAQLGEQKIAQMFAAPVFTQQSEHDRREWDVPIPLCVNVK